MFSLNLSTKALTSARAAAEDAARQAGQLLRDELSREGGPRRTEDGSNALVDHDMDLLIRSVLQTACPEFGLASEEGPIVPGKDRDTTWIIDAHDGTARFLAGDRHSAVSIGLVHQGEPIGGVVYAPLAPNHGGDLISWVQGQPLRRNGTDVHRAALPASLGKDDIVAFSPDADKAPMAVSTIIAPARFLAIGCPAYRLALVAVGEADAAALLSGLNTWDVAAGHALLRAVGGTLLVRRGVEVSYDNPVAYIGRCFAGTAKLAGHIAKLPWPSMWTREADVTEVPAVRVLVHNAEVLGRAQGCLLGLAAGDALGSSVEFLSAAEVARRHPDGRAPMRDGGSWNTRAGQPTDDTELAFALTHSLLDAGTQDLERTFESYCLWLKSQPFDVGTTTRAAFTGRRSETSESNGAMMRVAPLAVRMVSRPMVEVIEAARLDAMLTHGSQVVRDANAMFVCALVIAMRDKGHGGISIRTSSRAMTRMLRELGNEFAFHPKVMNVLDNAINDRADMPYDGPHSGWCLLALHNALHQYLHDRTYEEGVQDTIRRGGDTDTTAAIAGALLGAVHGYDAIPLAYRRLVRTCRAVPGSPQPRPSRYWPVHLSQQAEALMVGGLIEHAEKAEPTVVKNGDLGGGLTGTVTWQPDDVGFMQEMLERPGEVRDEAVCDIERAADLYIAGQLIVPSAGIGIRAGTVIMHFMAWLKATDRGALLDVPVDERDYSSEWAVAHAALWQRLHRHGGAFGRIDDEPYWFGVRFMDGALMEQLLEADKTAREAEVADPCWLPHVRGSRRQLLGLPKHRMPIAIDMRLANA